MKAAGFLDCRGIIFDFGGTLDGDGEHWLDRFYELYERAGLDVSRAEIKRAFYEADGRCSGDPQVKSLGLRPLMRLHVRRQFEALNLRDHGKGDELVEAFCARSEQFLQRNARLLARLKERYHLGLVSNFYGNVARLCKEAGMAESLEVILDSARVGISKPAVEIFQMALQSLGLAPPQVIFVGDSYERDMIPAGLLGMKTLWLPGPNPRIPAAARPVDGKISSLLELEELVG